MWFVLAILSGFFAALLAVIVKLHLKHLDASLISFLFYIVSLFVWLVIMAYKKTSPALVTTLTNREWIYLIIAGAFNGMSFLCYITALKYGKTCQVVAIDRLGILYVVLLSVVFLSETLSFKTIFGALLMVAGAMLL